MLVYQTKEDLYKNLAQAVKVKEKEIEIINKDLFINKIIDDLVWSANFSPQEEVRLASSQIIRQIAIKLGAIPSSIQSLYQEFGQGKISGFTVPACNLRTLTYETAQTIFQVMKEKNIGPVIFEIARSEIGYTNQPPYQYSASVLGGAIKTGYQGPVFIQGDHFQFKLKPYQKNPQLETKKIKHLIKESIRAGFYNIDIDASTLVDLGKQDLDQQQKENYRVTAAMTKYIRSIEPKNITVSIGGEIGHIGGKNSTVEDFEAFIQGYRQELADEPSIVGISKVSVQTGTSHGGIPLADGTIAQVKVDFDVLKNIGRVAREKYKIGGPVQHGASTLPDELFDKFPQVNTLEIHLATGFQNIIYQHLPQGLKNRIYSWIKENLKTEWKQGQTEKQFIYKTRKKALGPFKKELWDLPQTVKKTMMKNLKKKFELIFGKLKVFQTKDRLNF